MPRSLQAKSDGLQATSDGLGLVTRLWSINYCSSQLLFQTKGRLMEGRPRRLYLAIQSLVAPVLDTPKVVLCFVFC